MKSMTLEDAIKRGFNSRKITQIAREELGEDAVTRRNLQRRISEAERKVKG